MASAVARGTRVVIKGVEFLCTLLLLAILYHVGPHWVLLTACLAVPLYGLYLLLKKAAVRNYGRSLPYLQYKANSRAKSWIRADMVISLTMAIVTFGFAIVLFFGYFKVRSSTQYFLESAVVSSLLSFIYLIDSFLGLRDLNCASVEFTKEQPFTITSTIGSPKTQDVIRNGIVQTEHKMSQTYTLHQLPANKMSFDHERANGSSWFDEERKDSALVNHWPHNQGPAPQETVYLKVLHRETKEEEPDDASFSDSEPDDLPPPPPPPPPVYKTSAPFPRRIPVPPVRPAGQPTQPIRQRQVALGSSKFGPNSIPVNIVHAGSVHPPAYKARVVTVQEDEVSFERSNNSNIILRPIKGSSSDGSTVRIDDVDSMKRTY